MPSHGHTFKGSAPTKGTLKRILKELFRDYKKPLILALVCLTINSCTNFCASIFIKNITSAIEIGVKNNDFNGAWGTISIWLIVMASVYLVGMFAAYIWNITMGITTQKYLNTIRIKMFNHMQTLPIKYFDTNKHGDIMSRYTNDIDTIRQLVSQALPTTYTCAISITAILVIMFVYSIWLALIVLAGAFFMLLNVTAIGGRAGKYFKLQQEATGKVEGIIQESINGLKVIKVFTHEEKSIAQFDEFNDKLFEASNAGNKSGNIVGPIMGNIGNFIYVICALVGGIFLINAGNGWMNLNVVSGMSKPMDYATILAFLSISRGFTNAVNNFAQQFIFIVSGSAGASRVLAMIDEQSETDEGYVSLVHIKYNEDGTFYETEERTRDFAWKHPHKADGSITYTELKGDIVLDSVDFSYVEGKQVLYDISIYAKPGQKIALVGATGAGKTTITNLINRFYDIEDGKIRYDGINISKIKKDDLRHSLGIVLQDVNLFTGTVMDNIRYGRLDATDKECIEAAKIANAYDFITRLPEGFNTMLAGDGSNLSQGQRQLLSIARAAVADTPVLILDEATSSIDTRTEKLVQEGMDRLMEGRTVFVIAHRLSTVRNSNAIMVMDHGRIIERGTHEDLIKQKGTYYQLYTGAFELE